MLVFDVHFLTVAHTLAEHSWLYLDVVKATTARTPTLECSTCCSECNYGT